MAPSPAVSVAQVRATATEGRMRDLRHRQRQLISLHRQLTQNETEAISTLQDDDGLSEDEAKFVLAATLAEIGNHYDELDLKKELEAEYRVKRGKDHEQNMTVHPLAYIVPEPFAPLYSVLSALAAATEAGTCCVVKLDNDLRSTLPLLGRLFGQLHDKEAVCITTSEPEASFLDQCVVVNQAGNAKLDKGMADLKTHLRSYPESPCLGVVDRTADVKAAAKELVRSRLAFRGLSRQAVDCVFVNEFVVQEFVDAVVEEMKTGSYAGPNQGKRTDTKKEMETRRADLKALAAQGYQEVFNSAEVGSVTKTALGRKHDDFLGRKIASRTLSINVITSLDDAIDRTSNSGMELGALYVFAGLREAKYLCQYIRTHVSFVNHIPRRFQIGPTSPLGYPASNSVRYTRQMFEFSSPQFVVNIQGAETEDGAKLLAEALQPLKPTGQPKAGATGFFEVGVSLGAVVYLLPPVAAGITGIGFGLHKGYELLCRGRN